MIWGDQQNSALKTVDKWLLDYYSGNKKNKQQIFRLFGFAGSGKTTLAKHFAEQVDGDVCFAAFTGKAALMMSKKGCVGARTIHSLIYIAERNEATGEITFRLNRNQSPINSCKLVIIDECSMVDEAMGKDLLSFGKPVLVLGDPAQLPPINGAGFFTEGEPDFMLTEIHRQAKDSPIIYLATMAREGAIPEIGDYGTSRVVSKISSADFTGADQIICGRNNTRTELNHKMRKLKGFNEIDELPIKGDKLVCLQNDKDLHIFNGGIFTTNQQLHSKYKTNFLHLSLNSEDFDSEYPVMVKVHKSFFASDVPIPDWKVLKGSQQFDYGYVLSCHKSQGSQWENVLLYNEAWCFREMKHRWLYTAITRAASSVVILN